MKAYVLGFLLFSAGIVLFGTAHLRRRRFVKPEVTGFVADDEEPVVAALSPTIVVPGTGPLISGQLIFLEEFNTLNFSRWRPVVTLSGCGSGEFQIYDKHAENVFVKDGMLHIQPTLTVDRYGEEMLYNGTLELPGCNDPLFNGCKKTAGNGKILNPVISARLKTLGSFAFVYGKVEVRAKIPRGDWIWPAIWLNPSTRYYGDWPMSGEIDIMESRGNDGLYEGTNLVGNQMVSSALHFGTERSNDQWRKTFGFKRNETEGFHKDFHLYQLEWTPDHLTVSVDNEMIAKTEPPEIGGFYAFGGFNGTNIWSKPAHSARMAPFDIQMYIILNVAVGGTMGFFTDSYTSLPFPKPWKNWQSMDEAMLEFWEHRDEWYPTWAESSAMIVDYVKIWAI